MTKARLEPVGQDSRGILDPRGLRQRVRLTRYQPTVALQGLVDRFWAVRWDLPEGLVHHQSVLTHPGANLSVGCPDGRGGAGGVLEARLNGVARRLSNRTLVGQGFAVAAMTTPGGLGAFLRGPASEFTDRVVPLGEAIEVDEPKLLGAIADQQEEAARVALLAAALERAVDPRRAATARLVAEVAELAETDRSIRRLRDICSRVGIAPRNLQRMFLSEAGVSPMWVLRRYRLMEAAEAVREGQPVSWAEVATALGYSDQAHLIRDFRAALGRTPAAYAASQLVG